MTKETFLKSYEITRFNSNDLQAHNQNGIEQSRCNNININDGFSYYKMVTSCIRKQLLDSEKNELAYLIEEFVGIFELKSLKMINKFKRNESSYKEYEISKQALIHGFQQFIRVMEETLVLYYNLSDVKNSLKYSLFSKDNLLNFLISIMMDNEKIYDKLFEIESTLEYRIEENYKANCEILQNLNPQDFGIPDQYCLNVLTIKYLNKDKKPEIRESSIEKKNYIDRDVKTESNSPLKSENNENSIKMKKIINPKKLSCNDEYAFNENNESKNLEKTFHSASNSDIKKIYLKNAKFSFPNKKSSDSFNSAKMNSCSEINNFASCQNSVDNQLNPLEISEYYSISLINENINFLKKNSDKETKLSNPGSVEKNVKKINSRDLEENIPFKQSFDPYEKAIKVMKSFHFYKKPLEKMKKILEISDLVKAAIKIFYEENQLKAIKQKNLDSDELLSIFLFIILKSSVRFLRVHLKLIENFTTDNILNSKNGYYLMMLQLCLKFIDNVHSEELKKMNEEDRKISFLEKVRNWIREKRINKMMILRSGKMNK